MSVNVDSKKVAVPLNKPTIAVVGGIGAATFAIHGLSQARHKASLSDVKDIAKSIHKKSMNQRPANLYPIKPSERMDVSHYCRDIEAMKAIDPEDTKVFDNCLKRLKQNETRYNARVDLHNAKCAQFKGKPMRACLEEAAKSIRKGYIKSKIAAVGLFAMSVLTALGTTYLCKNDL